MTFSAFDSSAPSHPPRSVSPVNWSQDQLIRLEYEWRQLQRSFAFHPHVRVVPLQSETPSEYDVEFRVRTLHVADSGQLEYTEQIPMRITLPPAFPYTAPTVHPLKAAFHPNISLEGIHLSNGWQPTQTLVDYLQRIGELLAWRSYDPESIVNPMAAEWMETNAALLPTDPSADFAPDAGGDPLDRIYRNGKPALQQIRKQLERFRDTMLELDGAPGPAEVRDFSRQLRQSLNLFEQPDVPDTLRQEASDLEDWASELPGSLQIWESLRAQRGAAQAVRAACNALEDKREPLLKQMKALAALAPKAVTIDYPSAIAAIPSRKAMEIVQLKLPALVREADQILQGLHER
ncbi:MAG TPA: ubiquitin-conjugating enzyme E2, partial [Tepidisphaeraceae bacterium]|nr:ubiquitin-conjugating enzyme E2 [Tepidisphaeraceae bacterium]